MSSKNQVLRSIQQNRPPATELPAVPDFITDESQWLEAFQDALKANSGNAVVIRKAEEINDLLKKQFPDAKEVCSMVPEINGNVDISKIVDPHELKDLDVVVVRGELGVAENAAVWLSEKHLVQRVLPFITQHLVIVLDKKALVGNMHQAYAKIKIDESGYGVFIAGPSKTADIEQVLVIGAHGARSLWVGLIE